jgi:hypothetical protein
MDDFLERLLKIQSDYFKRKQLLFILDLISIFSIFYAIFFIITNGFYKLTLPVPVDIVEPVFAFVIALVGSFVIHRNDHKINITLITESKYPELREKLRTAYDNRNETNVIVDSLKNVVLSGLAIVSASKLLTASTIILKIIITVIFISGAFYIQGHPELQIPKQTFTNLTNLVTGGTEDNGTIIGASDTSMNLDKTNFRGAGDIFGKPKIASIEGKNIDLSLNSGSGTGSTVVDTSQPQNPFIKSAAFPVDILGSNVSDDYNNLVKRSEAEKLLINQYAVERSKI